MSTMTGDRSNRRGSRRFVTGNASDKKDLGREASVNLEERPCAITDSVSNGVPQDILHDFGLQQTITTK